MQTRRPNDEPFLETQSGGQPRYTFLLGYHEDLDVFIAWDVRAHPDPGTSSSLQVSLGTIEAAAASGAAQQARQTRTLAEIVLAWRGPLIGRLLDVLPEVNIALEAGPDAPSAVAALNGEDWSPEPTDEPRRVALQRVAKFVRDARFRAVVVDAYEGTCAFCGLGFGIVEAAHIRGVADGGADAVENGLAACPNHHEAFDRGLLVVDESLRPAVNRRRAEMLGISNEEVERIDADLRVHLRVPVDESCWPDREALVDHYERWLFGT